MSSLVQNAKNLIRAVPSQGIGYGLLRYMHPNPEVRNSLASQRGSEVLFNFLGRDTSESSLTEDFGVTRSLQLHQSPTIQGSFGIQINASLKNQLVVSWEYCGLQFESSQIQQVANDFLVNIGLLVEYCLGEGESEFHATDFPLAGLDNDKLKNLASILNKKDRKG